MGLAIKKKIESSRSKAGSDAQSSAPRTLCPGPAMRARRLPEGPALAEDGLVPEDKNGAHHQIAGELVARIDGEELHALPGKQSPGELHGGDETEPDVKAGHQAE